MIALLTPHHRMEQVADITVDWLNAHRIRGLLVDLDSTLVPDHSTACPDGCVSWLRRMRDAGLRLCVVSNSGHARVQSIVTRIDANLPFVYSARKPTAAGFRIALRRLQLEASDVVVVGDQIFSDVLGGRLLGARTILVRPTTQPRDQFLVTRWKRPLERWVLGD